MKSLKRIFALVLALMMIMSLAATAFAAEATETISVSSADTHAYDVYQIFVGTLDGATGTLSNIELGQNGKLPEGTTLAAALTALEALTNSSDTEKLAEATKYVDLTGTPVGTVSNGSSLDVEPGYYLMKDKGALADGEGYSLYILQVVGDVTVNPKRGKVTSEKKVDDVNDSTGYAESQKDSADYDIGDQVPFTLRGTLPEDYASYKTYYLAFHDTCGAGLTFNPASIKVFVGNTEITTGFEVKTTGLSDGCTFEVVFENTKTISSITAGSVITVKYTATLNENAALGFVGNTNVMKLEFSNDPNYTGDGDPDGENPPPTGFTPEDKVIVFTYQVVVNKVDADNKPLVGATFTLYKKLAAQPAEGSGVSYITETTGETTTYWQNLGSVVGTQLSTFTWTGIDDGIYRLVETATPAGYNSIDPIEFTVTATHDEEKADPHLLTLTGGTFTGDLNAGTLTASVENKPGAVLPGTGGMGTTIFYIVGGILVLAAVVMLVTKKRMSSAE